VVSFWAQLLNHRSLFEENVTGRFFNRARSRASRLLVGPLA
jgi:hypothetical protein